MHIIASFGIFDQWKNSIFDIKIEEIWLGLKIGSALNQFKVQIILIYNLNPSIWQWSFFIDDCTLKVCTLNSKYPYKINIRQILNETILKIPGDRYTIGA